MADLYLDEDVRRDAIVLLQGLGHAVVHARDYRKGAKDDVQLLTAMRAGWILVTNNRSDFELLHDAWHHWSQEWGIARPHTGILVTRNTWLPERLAHTINSFFATGRPATNRLYRWVETRGWEERVPPPL